MQERQQSIYDKHVGLASFEYEYNKRAQDKAFAKQRAEKIRQYFEKQADDQLSNVANSLKICIVISCTYP